MINFNSLPTNKPNSLPAPGAYYATIEGAEMRNSSDPTKPAYLSLRLSLTNKDGVNCGTVYDILSESNKDLVRYKLSRFLISLGLVNLGDFELVDLIKIIKNKRLIVDIKQEDANNGFPAKAVVDAFKGEIYYPLSEASNIFGTTTEQVTISDDNPFKDDLTINASDAADVHVTASTLDEF